MTEWLMGVAYIACFAGFLASVLGAMIFCNGYREFWPAVGLVVTIICVGGLIPYAIGQELRAPDDACHGVGRKGPTSTNSL